MTLSIKREKQQGLPLTATPFDERMAATCPYDAERRADKDRFGDCPQARRLLMEGG